MSSTPQSLELVPMEPPPGEAPAAQFPAKGAPEDIDIVAPGPGTFRPPAADAAAQTDRFAREAARQYAEGHIDQPLWDRAFAQANGDRQEAAQIYLKARATALRLLDRERRSAPRAQPAPAPGPAPAAHYIAEEDDEPTAIAHSKYFGLRRAIGRYRVPIIAASVIMPVVIGGWLLLSGRGAVAPVEVAVARTGPAAVAAKPAVAAADSKKSPPAKAGPTPEFMKKLREFRDGGNWNMVVLYAVEWTRLEPTNPAAWNELRAGYVSLKQYEDALNAARKAVDLAPSDAGMWRRLAQVQLEIDDPASALNSYGQATARDEQDVYSLRQVGLLQARLGHSQEAKVAFDRALAIDPADAPALCMRSSVAQLPPPRDGYSAAMQIKGVAEKCGG